MKEGDLNTSSFHKVASGRRRANFITPAMIPTLHDTDVVSLKETVIEVFKDRFWQSSRPQLLDWPASFPNLDSEQISELEVSFSEDEILQSLTDADGERTPGPDGFTFRFSQFFVGIFKGDQLGLFQKFYSDTDFDHRFSESFISLIPKAKRSSSLNDFRPISLFGVDP